MAQRVDGFPEYHVIVNRFLGQDQKLTSLEAKISAMEPTIQRLDNEFFNHDGGDGLKTIVLKHIAAVNQR